MERVVEKLIRDVTDRGFHITLENFGGSICCTVFDPHDPRIGCGQLRGESHAKQSIEGAIQYACTQAMRDEYPQSRGCGRAVGVRAPYSWCSLPVNHSGPCKGK